MKFSHISIIVAILAVFGLLGCSKPEKANATVGDASVAGTTTAPSTESEVAVSDDLSEYAHPEPGSVAARREAGEVIAEIDPMVGAWGRNWAHAKAFWKIGYTEHEFNPDGTCSYSGYNFGERFKWLGTYEFDGQTLEVVLDKEEVNGRVASRVQASGFTTKIERDQFGQSFEVSSIIFTKGLHWDSTAEIYLLKGAPLTVAGKSPVQFVTERAPEPGSKEACIATMRGIFKALAGYADAHDGNWPNTLSQRDFLGEYMDGKLLRCPRTGQTYRYNESGPDVIVCDACKQKV